ncbi:MAG: M28 family peptidase, partial [Candidatus Promineifilaceae bacterium]
DGNLSGEWPVIVGDQPFTITTRYTDSGEPIEKATEYVAEHMGNLDLDVEYHVWNVSRPPNVIGEMTGETDPDDIFLITAHLDDVVRINPLESIIPGADDNASGSTAVMIAADIFSQYRWGCTLRFAFFTGEEQGLLGSNAYANRSFQNGENIVGVLNLDMIGWNTPGSSRDIDLHAKSAVPGSVAIAQLFADVVDTYNIDLIPQISTYGSGGSDHVPFWNNGYAAILGIEDLGDFNDYYHTTNDLLRNMDIDYFTEFVRASIGTFAYMTSCMIPTESGEDHLFYLPILLLDS